MVNLAPPEEHDGPADIDVRLSTILGEIARTLQQDHNDLDATLNGICDAARLIPGAEDAGITLLLNGSKLDSKGQTGPIPDKIDLLQERIKQGPCVDAARDQEMVRVDDMRTESRWPQFSPAAAAAGVRSMLSFQLWVEDSHLGALNMYSTTVNAFDESSEQIANPLAAHASVALAGARREEQLREAVDSRDLIGQAKGMLMQQYSINADQAFDLLTKLSQERNVKVRQIAESITERGLN
ncbi:GAF and ANTAR domain-containing protein [Antrihabitans cavernicola]|uniref:GAF and ANTAR domain-containing protein n=1 Tax=Antrihabitans cavernicola TaxID=2495913 RepID=A0A5A7S3V0_9NOCA|nr:GAF and ANTAR domain-containing protein [Spelaeibacter cavernicola]KAA0020081.1 GAF and ANTAR domain-containing protein [Spelaeibacter cavernicola]